MKRNILYLLFGYLIALPFHYYVTLDMLFIIGLLPGYIQIIIFMLEGLIFYEIIKFIFDEWKIYDKAFLFVTYYIGLLFQMFARMSLGESIYNLNPISFIYDIVLGTSYDVLLFVLNIILFVPMPIVNGFFVKNQKKNFLVSVLIGVVLETLQYITQKGVFDLGDITVYVIGIVIGIFLNDKIFKSNRCV